MTRQRFTMARYSTLAALVAALIFAAASIAAAQTETVIHTFQSNKNDGAGTSSGLVADSRGALYGVTAIGGKYGEGAVYRFTPPTVEGGAWTETIIYSFTGADDGRTPTGNLFIDPHSQHIFGTAPLGGVFGNGVVFELTPGSPWTETVLYSFKGNPDGATPKYGVVMNNKGVVYGTAGGGGSRGYGVIFRLEPPAELGGAWKESILYRFTGGSDGAYPFAGVVLDSTNSVYGTTYDYESSSAGTVFRLSPPAGSGPWTLTTLYTFTGGTDGSGPSGGLIFDSAGSLYGTTQSGGDPICTANKAASCGTVFKLAPPSEGAGPWTESVLYAFTGGTDGGQPSASLIFDSTGTLYSTTLAGGDLTDACGTYGAGFPEGCGTVFKLSPTVGGAWTESVLYAFEGPPNGPSDGASPVTPLVFVGSNLFGTTAWGGYPFGDDGEVFEVIP